MAKLKRSRSPSDDGMDTEIDAPVVKKKVRFGPFSTIPSYKPTYLHPQAAEDYDTLDGIPSSTTSPPKLRHQMHKLGYRKAKGGSPLKEIMASSPPDSLSSIQDVDMDTSMDADIEDISSSDTETIFPRSRLTSPPPPLSPSPTSRWATTPNIKFSFLVSGYDRVSPTPQSQALRLQHPEMAWMHKLTPVENQIAVQLNRGRTQGPLALDIRELGSFTEEREDIRTRFGVEGRFTVVYTKSREDREVAMRSLMKEGLFYGAPDLKVQVFGGKDGDNVEMGGEMEYIGDSPSPFSDMTAEEPATPSCFNVGTITVHFRQVDINIQGLEDQLSDDTKKVDISVGEEDIKML
ncbi:hypothetical protein DL98DRAFT_584407 [Cadophora sp. DSE1049]|nr:hypothetical protein DL98DRAFT_584407 [Cadophora sp. DSE1049]